MFIKKIKIFSPDSKKFEEAIDLRTNDDVTEIEVEKKVSVKSQFKVRKFLFNFFTTRSKSRRNNKR